MTISQNQFICFILLFTTPSCGGSHPKESLCAMFRVLLVSEESRDSLVPQVSRLDGNATIYYRTSI